MVWNLNDSPDILYNVVEELVTLAAAGNVPKTQTQIFTVSVKMIRKTQDFETGPSEWFKRP